MLNVNDSDSIMKFFKYDFGKSDKTNKQQQLRKDSLEISNTSKAFKKVESFLNLGKPDRLDTSDLNEAERDEFLKMLGKLLQHGIVGYEILEVDGKPEKHYLVTQLGNDRIRGAKLYNKPGFYRE